MSTKHEIKSQDIKSIIETITSNKHQVVIKNNQTKNYIFDLKTEKSNIEIKISENSHVSFLILSYQKQLIDIKISASLGRFSSANFIFGFLNDQSNIETKVYLNGEAATANINSLLVSKYNQTQKAYYEIINNYPYTNANIDVIGIANGNGEVRVDGIGQINKGMHQSNNFQHLTGIISDDAVIEMNPYLLIDEHDVQAGHGATIGQIDENIIYYMMSRGISKDTASNLYIKGVITPFVDKIFARGLCEDFNKYLWSEQL